MYISSTNGNKYQKHILDNNHIVSLKIITTTSIPYKIRLSAPAQTESFRRSIYQFKSMRRR